MLKRALLTLTLLIAPMCLGAVTSTTSTAAYTGNGSTTAFPVPFKFMAAADLTVTSTVSSVVTTLRNSIDYTVTGAASDSGGTVTMTTAPASGVAISITRSTPITQPTAYASQGAFLPKTHEASFDRLTLEVQDEAATRQTLATKEANDITGVSALVSALNGVSHSVTDTSSVLAFGSTTARTLTSRFSDVVNVRDYGAIGDGVVDDSAAIQAAIDANKGKTIILPNGTYLAAGIILGNSTYNGTRIISTGGVLKLKADAGGSNFQSAAWVGLVVGTADGVYLDLQCDGNRSAMTGSEHIFCLGVAGSTRLHIARLIAKEIRGDALYIGQSTWTSSGTDPTDITIGSISAYNSTDDGRNAVSIISGKRINIASLTSYQVGGWPPALGVASVAWQATHAYTVGAVVTNGTGGGYTYVCTVGGTSAGSGGPTGTTVGVDITDGSVTWRLALDEPGGLDLEPDATYQTIQDVTVGNVNVVTAGTGGAQVTGKAVTNDGTRDWNIQRVRIGNASIIRTGTTASGLSGLNFFRTSDLSINGSLSYSNGYGTGWVVAFDDRVSGTISASHVSIGARVGALAESRDVDLRVMVNDYSQAGLQTAAVTRARFTGHISNATVVSSSTPFAIQCNNFGGAAAQVQVTYSVDAPYNATTTLPTRAFRNEPANACTFDSASYIRDCDYTGYSSYTTAIEASSTAPIKANVAGINRAAAQPGNGGWNQGEYVEYTSPILANGAAVLLGWKRLTTSNANVLGTDWLTLYAAYTATYGTLTPTNGGTVTPDASLIERYEVSVGSGVTAYTIATPLNPSPGQLLEFTILNASGGATATTFSAGGFRLAGGAWTDPANNKQRSIGFRYQGSTGVWRELWRSSGDI